MLTLATSPVAPSMKLTSSIGDKSPGHNQKDEERQKCKGDGYDHCCSANLRKHTHVRLADIAQKLNPLLQGWLNYYGRYCPSAMYPMWKYINATLVAWAKLGKARPR